MINYRTNNYDLSYPHIVKNDSIILEVYRNMLYNKLKKKINDLRKQYDEYLTEGFTYDIMSILLFNHEFKSEFDPIFDISSPFTKNNICSFY